MPFQKWEYLSLMAKSRQVDLGPSKKSLWARIDGQREVGLVWDWVDGSTTATTEEKFNQLGSQGWELVSFVGDVFDTSYTRWGDNLVTSAAVVSKIWATQLRFVFKRPLP